MVTRLVVPLLAMLSTSSAPATTAGSSVVGQSTCQATLTVRVVDDSDDTPVEGALVAIIDTQRWNNTSGVTDRNGTASFHLRGNYDGSRCVDGTASVSRDGYVGRSMDYQVYEPGGRRTITVALFRR